MYRIPPTTEPVWRVNKDEYRLQEPGDTAKKVFCEWYQLPDVIAGERYEFGYTDPKSGHYVKSKAITADLSEDGESFDVVVHLEHEDWYVNLRCFLDYPPFF